MIKPVGKRLSAAFFMRWLSVMLFALACHEAVAAQQGIVTSTSAGANVTAGKYGVLMSLGQPGSIGTSSSSRYKMMFGHVPATLLPPDLAAPTALILTGAVQNQIFQVSAASLASLLNVSDPDGLGFAFQVTALAGELKQQGTTQTSVLLGQADNFDWVPPANQSGTINALSVVMQRGEYPDATAVSVSVSVISVNTPPVANAGSAQTVDEGTTVTLDGSGSIDADAGDTITYAWTAPTGIALSDATLVNPTFTAPDIAAATGYSFSLVVNDGTVDSNTATVTITVNPVTAAPTLAGPSATNSPTPTLTGTAEVGSTVEVFEGATSLGQATADATRRQMPRPGITPSHGLPPCQTAATPSRPRRRITEPLAQPAQPSPWWWMRQPPP